MKSTLTLIICSSLLIFSITVLGESSEESWKLIDNSITGRGSNTTTSDLDTEEEPEITPPGKDILPVLVLLTPIMAMLFLIIGRKNRKKELEIK